MLPLDDLQDCPEKMHSVFESIVSAIHSLCDSSDVFIRTPCAGLIHLVHVPPYECRFDSILSGGENKIRKGYEILLIIRILAVVNLRIHPII